MAVTVEKERSFKEQIKDLKNLSKLTDYEALFLEILASMNEKMKYL